MEELEEPMEVSPPDGHGGSSGRVLQAAQRALRAPYRQPSGACTPTNRKSDVPRTLDDDRCEGCERVRRVPQHPVIRPVSSIARSLHQTKDITPDHPTHQQNHHQQHHHQQHHFLGTPPFSHLRPGSMPARVTGQAPDLSEWTDSVSEFRHSEGRGQSNDQEPSLTTRSNIQMAIQTPAFPDLQLPDPELWQRAAAYRMNTTSASRSTGHKIIIRNRKQKPSVPNPDRTESPVVVRSRPSSRFCRKGSIPLLNPEDYEGVLEDEDHDLDLVTSGAGVTEEQVYAHACRQLGVVPVAGMGRYLVTDELPLRNRKVGPKGARACATVLVNNVDVRKLDLEGNDLGSEGTGYIAEMLKENITITELNLRENFVESEGLRTLCDVLKDYGRIHVLDLSGNNLQDKHAKYIGEMLEENRTIRELYLAHNALSEAAGEYLGPAIASNDALEMLDLSWNHLRLQGAVAFVQGLKENNSISTLNLAWNGLHVEGCRVMTEVLATATTLTYLDLSCNRINCLGLKYLLDGLKKNSSISVLKLGYNPISTDGAILILKTVHERGSELPLRELELADICVDSPFIQLLKAVRKKRMLAVKHGMILKNDDLGFRPQSDPFSLDDPMTVLMEFMRIRNLRLIDLFACLDKDGNKSLSREEFRDGLMSVNIPLSSHALNELIDKLDTDGDGEVDFSELLEGQKQHKKKITRLLARSQDNKLHVGSDSDLGRVNAKIRALMAMTSLAARAKHRGQSVTSEGGVLPVGMAEGPVAAWRRMSDSTASTRGANAAQLQNPSTTSGDKAERKGSSSSFSDVEQ